MNDAIFDVIADQISKSYINLFIIALNNQIDLRTLVMEIDDKTNDYINSDATRFYPKGFEGFLFMSELTKAMGLSLFDVIYYSEEEKKQAVQHILDVMGSINYDINNLFNDDETGQMYFEGFYSFDDEDEQKNCYIIRFGKTTLGEKDSEYSIEVFLSEDEVNREISTDYMYDSAIIWSETDGFVANYIESTIASIEENEQAKEIQISENEGRDDESKKEILVYLRPDTKTIELMDEFDEQENGSYVYERMINLNSSYIYSKLGKYGFIYCSFVIEHVAKDQEFVGDITMTRLKQNKTRELVEYTELEISNKMIVQYIDTDRFFRFSKPFRLRAQNSGNRIGYGWEWDWSGGYGDYVEGTQYGEMTDYGIVGVYLSSDNNYNPDNRRTFLEKTTKLISNGKTIGSITVAPYAGKLTSEIRGKTVPYYVKIKTKYVAMAFDKIAKIGYVEEHAFKKYKDELLDQVELISSEKYKKLVKKSKTIPANIYGKARPTAIKWTCKKCKQGEIFREGLCWECYKYEMDTRFE